MTDFRNSDEFYTQVYSTLIPQATLNQCKSCNIVSELCFYNPLLRFYMFSPSSFRICSDVDDYLIQAVKKCSKAMSALRPFSVKNVKRSPSGTTALAPETTSAHVNTFSTGS